MAARKGGLQLAILAALLALTAGGPATAASRIDHEASTTWRRLTWDDFRGPLGRGTQSAGIVSTILVDIRGVEVEERADGSFVARPRHPQVYALMDRRLHARMADFEVVVDDELQAGAALQGALQALHQETILAMLRMQQGYDGETGHGTGKRAQKRWAREVAELLAAEEPYLLK